MEAQPSGPQPGQNQNRTLLFVGGGLLLLVVLACCALAVIGTLLGAFRTIGVRPAGRVTDTLERRVAVEAPLVLTIDNPVGEITLKPDATGEVRVKATRFAPSQETLDQINVNLRGSGGQTTVEVTGPQGRSNWGTNLVVHVPPQTGATIEVGVGKIRLDGLEGGFSVRSGVGDIVAQDLTVHEDAEFEAGTGDMELGAALDEGVTLRANSGVGAISIGLPADMGSELDASTGTGNITLQGFDLEEGQHRDRAVGDEIHSRTVADPNGRHLILSTGVGDILIRAR
ncbi:MAG: DUF4097 domain-containing protein [Ardenticatenaceae bacterium]|nr:DUF4097 domain-containing protein [Ardenticatenaceae bacterium]HBY97930.1 hypothetical protein [Chloroflexota bacterium]